MEIHFYELPTILYPLMLLGPIGLARPVTVFLHELGHGLTALMVTKGQVKIYFGSRGDEKRSFKVGLGRLRFFIFYNPFKWYRSLTTYTDTDVNFKKDLLMVAMGPVITLLLLLSSIYMAFISDLPGEIKVVSFFLMVSSFVDFLAQALLFNYSVQYADGSYHHRDGYQIKRYVLNWKLFQTYMDAYNFISQKEFAKAAQLYQQLIDEGYDHPPLFRTAISLYAELDDWDSANQIVQKLEESPKIDANDLSFIGLIYSWHEKHQKALVYFEKAILHEPTNLNCLSNKAYTLDLLGDFKEAIDLFNQILETDAKDSYAQSGRGLAKINLGLENEGLNDLQTAVEINENEPYAHRNMGIYHFDRGEFATALQYFETAEKLKTPIHLLDQYLEKTRAKLEKG